MADEKPEYGGLTEQAWNKLRAKAHGLRDAVGANSRWQYIAIAAFPELIDDNRVWLPRDEAIERLTDDLKLTRRLNHAQGEALIALRHTVVCWPPKSTKEAALFDCSALQIAKEDVEAVQRVLKERDEARAELAACHREDEGDSKARTADVFLFETRIERLTKVLRNVLWVARGATDSPLEDAFGHALSNIEMRVEEALGIGPEDEVEHDEVEETP